MHSTWFDDAAGVPRGPWRRSDPFGREDERRRLAAGLDTEPLDVASLVRAARLSAERAGWS